MQIAYNRLVALLAPALAESKSPTATLEKLGTLLGTSNTMFGSTAEEQLLSIFGQVKEISGTASIQIAHLFGKQDAEVFDAVMQDTRAALEKGTTATPKTTPRAAKKEKSAPAQRYGSTSSIATARGGRADHKLG